MRKSKENEFDDIIERAESYRKELAKSELIQDLSVIKNIFNSNFKNKQKADATSEDNIYIDCRITAEEAKCGYSKIIKYSRINKDNKKVKNVITVNIPKGIQDGQIIVLCNEGNHLENEKYSNLVISIKIK